MNKVIISILIFLAILSGGLGYYSYTLGQQINSLSEQLVLFQTEQTALVGAVNDEFLAFRGEALSTFGNLTSELEENTAEISNLGNKVDDNLSHINTLEGKLDGTQANIDAAIAQIDSLEDQIKDATGLSRSVIDAGKVFQRVGQATVRISDGERTIGSGFIFDNEAHVMTANHVVEELGEKIFVILSDGRSLPAVLIGTSIESDVAVLQLTNDPAIEPPPLADSAKVKIGEPVATVGNPFDLPETLTTGIVSQVNRFAEVRVDSQTRGVANLIQFDAAVNFGNSGGPLANASGEIIGMVIARVEPGEGDGIYYAVSSNKLKRVADVIIAQGYFDYPWLGVFIVDLTPQIAQAKALETINGVLVDGILADGPAEVAGIRIDDIIIAIDGTGVRNSAELTSYLGEHKSPGEEAVITLIRGNRNLELSLEIGKRPS